ncbi:MAG: hypothetical protein KDB27_29380 [Planctomycetales bacterium]|nr:hypothetical protein [Planctomycetales bacterium]
MRIIRDGAMTGDIASDGKGVSMSKQASIPIIICAQQRSGTTVLHSNLGQSPYATNYGEVFLDQPEINPYNFFTFKIDQVKQNPELCFPTRPHQREICEKYLEFLSSSCETPFHVLDVKYNSWHHFNPVWYGLFNYPFLMEIVRSRHVPIIHVIRKDVFQQRVSIAFAEATQDWHFPSNVESKPKDVSIRLDPAHCQREMELSQRRTAMFREWFAGHDRYLELNYEEMFENGEFAPSTLSSINELMRMDMKIPQKPALKKGIKSVSKVISNRGELLNHFKGTCFESMVCDSLQA